MVHAACEKATVHDEHGAGNEAGRVGREKYRCADEVFELAEAFHGSAQDELASAAGAIEQGGVKVSAKNAGRDRVDADSLGRPFNRERFRQRSDRGLAG